MKLILFNTPSESLRTQISRLFLDCFIRRITVRIRIRIRIL